MNIQLGLGGIKMKEENLKCPHAEKVWVNPKNRNDYVFEYQKGFYPDILCRKTEAICDLRFNYKQCEFYVKWDKE